MPFRVNNRLDIYDVIDRKWREAQVIELQKGKNDQVASIKVHFRGYNNKYDVWIDVAKEASRIKQVGSYSMAEGHAKYSVRVQQELRDQEENLKQKLSKLEPAKILDGSGWGIKFESKQADKAFDYNQIDWVREERNFRAELQTKNLMILQVGGDGNCLFRAIAHQAYGDEDQHRMVRSKCMDYILSEKDYFKDFIEGGSEASVEAYAARKRQNAVWGDDIEIQALSEIYDRPIEIYAYSKEPMRTFHEQMGPNQPFRLSYHGGSHYNSIVSKDWNFDQVYIKTDPGVAEDQAVAMSKTRFQEHKTEEEKSSFEEEQVDSRTLNLRSAAQMIQRSREEFQIQKQQAMNEALIQQFAYQYSAPIQPGSTALYRHLEKEQIQRAIELSQQQETISEEEMIKKAMEESMKDQAIKEGQYKLSVQEMNAMFSAAALAHQDDIESRRITPAMQIGLESGFSLEQVVEAQSIVGDDGNMILSYLFDKLSL